MTFELDATDWRVVEELQDDARISFAELGRRVGLSAPAVTERVRRLEENGVIEGYGVRLGLATLGLPLLAYVRVKYPSGDYRPFERLLRDRSEILECHHVTGDDCFIVKVAARSMRHLEETTGSLARLGSTTTSVVYSTPLAGRKLTAPPS